MKGVKCECCKKEVLVAIKPSRFAIIICKWCNDHCSIAKCEQKS